MLKLFASLSRLIAVVDRVVVLAQSRKMPVTILMMAYILEMVCHALEAVEKSLQD